MLSIGPGVFLVNDDYGDIFRSAQPSARNWLYVSTPGSRLDAQFDATGAAPLYHGGKRARNILTVRVGELFESLDGAEHWTRLRNEFHISDQQSLYFESMTDPQLGSLCVATNLGLYIAQP